MEELKPRKIKSEATIPYLVALGDTAIRFFDGLKSEKILGTICKDCGRVFVYPRRFCPRCFEELNDWVEVESVGTVVSWSYTNYKIYGFPMDPPFVLALIKLDGSSAAIAHVIRGFDLSDYSKVAEMVSVGSRVRAVWSKEKLGNMSDIAYFEPI